MKLGIVVLAHRLPDQVGRLLSALRHPDVSLYLHVDARAPLAPFLQAIGAQWPDGMVLLPRYAHHWGSPAIVDATVSGLSQAVQDECDYVVLISGQDFPLRPVTDIVTFFEQAAGRSYMAHWPLPSSRWRFEGRDRIEFYSYALLGRQETCVPPGEDLSALNLRGRALNLLLRARSLGKPARRFPSYLQPFGGWQWWNLSRAAARYVLEFLERHPDYRAYHERTVCASEVFFQSILAGTRLGHDHELVDDSLRFTRWHPGANHPEVLRESDLDAMLASGQLFARKFDQQVDPRVLERLAAEVVH